MNQAESWFALGVLLVGGAVNSSTPRWLARAIAFGTFVNVAGVIFVVSAHVAAHMNMQLQQSSRHPEGSHMLLICLRFAVAVEHTSVRFSTANKAMATAENHCPDMRAEHSQRGSAALTCFEAL